MLGMLKRFFPPKLTPKDLEAAFYYGFKAGHSLGLKKYLENREERLWILI